MAYEMVMPYHLHMPSYFLETFTEYPYIEGCPSADTGVSEDAEEAAFVVLVLLFKWIFSSAG